MKIKLLSIILLFQASFLSGQIYTDYIGGGHSLGISATSSDELQKENWNRESKGINTLNGSGLEGKLMDASRFLAQATFGANLQVIKEVSQMDFEVWIDQQINITPTFMLPNIIEIYNTAVQIYVENGGNIVNYEDRPEWQHFDYAWWQVNMTNEDLLRQRIAFALSEILVISVDSDLFQYGEALGDYYDILIDNAFGNFEDILLEVSLHPSMGVYLSHLNNPKAIPERNIHPDENYAREIMQLFSIGLYELNIDGSKKTNSNGDFIPTYSNDDIKEFAKIFTGLGAGGVISKDDITQTRFNLGNNIIDFTIPMVMYNDYHEEGEKHLLNGFTIPTGQDGMTDVINNKFV